MSDDPTERNKCGLTPTDEAALAREYAGGAAKTPTAEHMAHYRALGQEIRRGQPTFHHDLEPDEIDLAAKAHYDQITGHDLPLNMRRARARTLTEEPFGNDGLTDAERAASAQRWRDGAGRAPGKDEMQQIRSLTPITYKPRISNAPNGLVSGEPLDDLSEEDVTLVAQWLAGPGARPTPDDVARWRHFAAELRATGQIRHRDITTRSPQEHA